MLGFDLLQLCKEGTAEGSGGARIDDTEVAQPALLVASLAALTAWQEDFALRGEEVRTALVGGFVAAPRRDKFAAASVWVSAQPPRFDAAAGLSLGEYTALCFAGALSFRDAVLLTRRRGQVAALFSVVPRVSA